MPSPVYKEAALENTENLTIKNIKQLWNKLIKASIHLYVLRQRYASIHWLMVCLFITVETIFALLMIPDGGVWSLVFGGSLVFLYVFRYAYERSVGWLSEGIDITSNRECGNNGRIIFWNTFIIALVHIAFAVFIGRGSEQALYATACAGAFILFNAWLFYVQGNTLFVILLLVKGALFSLALYYALGDLAWGYARIVLENIGDYVDLSSGSWVSGIIMSAGSFFAFKDCLDVLGKVPYDRWNSYANSELRLRRIGFVFVLSGYLICFAFRLWKKEFLLIGDVVAISALVAAEFVAKMPPVKEQVMLRIVARSILSKMKFPILWTRQLSIVKNDSERYAVQLLKFAHEWLRVRSKKSFHYQLRLINKIIQLMGIFIEEDGKEYKNRLYFIMGCFCYPPVDLIQYRVLFSGKNGATAIESFCEEDTVMDSWLYIKIGMRIGWCIKNRNAEEFDNCSQGTAIDGGVLALIESLKNCFCEESGAGVMPACVITSSRPAAEELKALWMFFSEED